MILAKSSVAHIAAQRRSFLIDGHLALAFSYLGVANMLLDIVGGMLPEQGKTVRKGDVLLAISFSPYANEVLKLAGNTQAREFLR